jgi:hypothetical protein
VDRRNLRIHNGVATLLRRFGDGVAALNGVWQVFGIADRAQVPVTLPMIEARIAALQGSDDKTGTPSSVLHLGSALLVVGTAEWTTTVSLATEGLSAYLHAVSPSNY